MNRLSPAEVIEAIRSGSFTQDELASLRKAIDEQDVERKQMLARHADAVEQRKTKALAAWRTVVSELTTSGISEDVDARVTAFNKVYAKSYNPLRNLITGRQVLDTATIGRVILDLVMYNNQYFLIEARQKEGFLKRIFG